MGLVHPEDNKIKGDIPKPDSSFMGKNQIESFSSLTDPSSVDRSGRAISVDSLDPVGIKTAMNPSMATPEIPPGNQSTELEGMYSKGMAKVNLPKKSGTHKDDATYGIKATSGIKRLKK